MRRTPLAGGSSPRGRGKRDVCARQMPAVRLIPAWAGKTDTFQMQASSYTAHPRVGGENITSSMVAPSGTGSSPRGRGKLFEAEPADLVERLIPAWAGKTQDYDIFQMWARAHPRVGGENSRAAAHSAGTGGSSPRGRGKHFLTCAFIERIGQILETLELAVSSESYTLSAAYATDAPQDQARNTGLALPSSRAAS